MQVGEMIDEIPALSHLAQLTLIIFFVNIKISKRNNKAEWRSGSAPGS